MKHLKGEEMVKSKNAYITVDAIYFLANTEYDYIKRITGLITDECCRKRSLISVMCCGFLTDYPQDLFQEKPSGIHLSLYASKRGRILYNTWFHSFEANSADRLPLAQEILNEFPLTEGGGLSSAEGIYLISI